MKMIRSPGRNETGYGTEVVVKIENISSTGGIRRIHKDFAITQGHRLSVAVDVVQRGVVHRIIAGALEEIDQHVAAIVLQHEVDIVSRRGNTVWQKPFQYGLIREPVSVIARRVPGVRAILNGCNEAWRPPPLMQVSFKRLLPPTFSTVTRFPEGAPTTSWMIQLPRSPGNECFAINIERISSGR